MKTKQQVAVAGVVAFLALVVVVIVVAFSHAGPPAFQRSLPTVVFAPAPRQCPHGIERGGLISSRDEMVTSMANHIPSWLPKGFGLSGAYRGAPIQAWMEWSDAHCRFVTVSYGQVATAAHRWKLDYDKAAACGNYIMGMGRCIGYTARALDGVVYVQTIGLSDVEAGHSVRSIQL